jgi:hypothetical protein
MRIFRFDELQCVTIKGSKNVAEFYCKTKILHRDYVNIRVILYSATLFTPFASKSLNTAYCNQENENVVSMTREAMR